MMLFRSKTIGATRVVIPGTTTITTVGINNFTIPLYNTITFDVRGAGGRTNQYSGGNGGKAVKEWGYNEAGAPVFNSTYVITIQASGFNMQGQTTRLTNTGYYVLAYNGYDGRPVISGDNPTAGAPGAGGTASGGDILNQTGGGNATDTNGSVIITWS